MSTKKRSHERDPFSLFQASWIGFFTKIPLLCCWFHYLSVLSRFSEPFWKLPGESRQTALKLTPKGLDYTQIDTLREPCITDLWFWDVLGQSQTDLWKLYTTIPASLKSRPPVQNQNLAHVQKRDCVPLKPLYQSKEWCVNIHMKISFIFL